METMTLTWDRLRSWALYSLVGMVLLLILAAFATPNLLRSRMAADHAMPVSDQRAFTKSESVLMDAKLQDVAEQRVAEPGTVQAATLDRKVIRKGALDVIVGNPTAALDQIGAIAHRHGGYVVSSELTGRKENQRGTITIRVPAAQFDPVRDELKKLAKTVESEQTSADDVTMQYAENEATLRNFRAEEASYLAIMQRSGAIKDTLQVVEQLSDVRGRIERLDAEIRTTSLETEMTAIQISISAEPIAVAGQHWRPLYELRAAWNDGVDAVTTYATAMIGIMLYLPAVLLWIATIALAGKLSWMLLQLGARLFRAPKSHPAAS